MRKYILLTAFVALVSLPVNPFQAHAGKITGIVKAQGLRSSSNILVYLAKAPPEPLDASGTNFVMDQRDLTFIPQILPVIVGATVKFPNNDKVNHNVFSLSRSKKFNLGSYKPGEIKTVVFDKPGIVEVRCDVHAEMIAYIMVMKSSYWAVTDEKGRFEIPDAASLKQSGIRDIPSLPAGSYIVKTWHAKLKTQKIKVDIPEKGQVPVQLNVTRGVPGVLYK